MVDRFLKEDITIIAQLYNVKHISDYKTTSSIQAQVSIVHGEGKILLVPNHKIGAVGKSKKYCTTEEAMKLKIEDLELEKFWNEMKPFLLTK